MAVTLKEGERSLWSGKPKFTDDLFRMSGFQSGVVMMWVAAGVFLAATVFEWYVLRNSGAQWYALFTLVPVVLLAGFALFTSRTLNKVDGVLPQSQSVEYTLTNKRLVMPGWVGWYEMGYPTNERLMTPDKLGVMHDVPLKSIQYVSIERSKKDEAKGTGTVVIGIPSSIWKTGSGLMRIYHLEHIADYEKVAELIKKQI